MTSALSKGRLFSEFQDARKKWSIKPTQLLQMTLNRRESKYMVTKGKAMGVD